MAQPIGVLRAELSANVARFAEDMGRAKKIAYDSSASMARSFDTAGKSFGRSASRLLDIKGILAGITVGSIAAIVNSSLAAAEAIGKTADAAGVGTSALQELRFAAEQSGSSAANLDTALLFFTKSLGQARAGTGTLAEMLGKLDSGLLSQVRNAGSTEDAMYLVLRAMEKMTSSSDRAALAAAAFGRSAGVEMVNLLRDGVAGIDALREKARDMGIVLDESMIRKADETKDKIEALSAVLRTQMMAAVGDALPAIEALADALGWAAQKAAKLSAAFPGASVPYSKAAADVDAIAMKMATLERHNQANTEEYRNLEAALTKAQEALKKQNATEDELAKSRSKRSTDTSPWKPANQEKPFDMAAWEKRQETSAWGDVIQAETQKRKDAAAIVEEARSSEEKLRMEKERIAALEPQLTAQLGSEAAAHQVIAQAQGQVEQKYKKVSQLALQAQSAIANGFTDAIFEGKNLRDTLQGIIQDLARIVVQMAMMKMVGSAFGFGFGMWAEGGAFNHGRVMPMARGGIVNGPTLFPMASGMGLMGEAGPEAVLPLKRIGGALGVQAEVGGAGGGITLEQNFNVNGMDFSDPRAIKRIMQGVAAEAKAGTSEALRMAGLLKDQADLNSRRAF